MNFMLFLIIFKIYKILLWTFWRKNCISLDLQAHFSLKPCKAFRTVQTATISKAMFKFWSTFHIQNHWYRVTRDNNFLQSTSQFLLEMQENPPPPSSLDTSARALIFIFFLDFELELGKSKELNNKRMRVRVKRAFKSYFLSPKNVLKSQTGSGWNYLQSPIQVCRDAYIPYFIIKAPVFCCPLFLKEYLNPQVRINEMISEHFVNYYSSTSQLTREYTLSYFFGLLRRLFFQNIFFFFLLKLHTPPTQGNYPSFSDSVFWRSI